MRARDLPSKKEAPDLILVDPHMNLYSQLPQNKFWGLVAW